MGSAGYSALSKVAELNATGPSQAIMAKHVERLATLEEVGGTWVKSLKGDAGARVSKALLGDDRFKRWGKHYLRAFTRAHQVQYCTNFMDKSLQDYGGGLFKALREEGDSIFISLPPPQPARKPRQEGARLSTSSATPAKPDMSVYYGGSGGG